MKRINIPELEDYQWFPKSWRDYGTDYLSFVAEKFKIYKRVAPLLAKLLQETGYNSFIDCASGGGSGLNSLCTTIQKDIPKLKVVLTDFYPNMDAMNRLRLKNPKVFIPVESSVDVSDIPEQFSTLPRTMFGAFHHFNRKKSAEFFQSAIDKNVPVAVFEPVGKNFPSFFGMVLIPVNVLFFTPFIRPLRWNVLLFIYLIPLVPLFIMWDGLASIFRTHSRAEILKIIHGLDGFENYEWETGNIKSNGPPITFLIGKPKGKILT